MPANFFTVHRGPALVAPTITDNLLGTPTYVSGDTKNDGLVGPGETWIYTANYKIPSPKYDSRGGWDGWDWGSCGQSFGGGSSSHVWGICGGSAGFCCCQPQPPSCGQTSITNIVTVSAVGAPTYGTYIGGDSNLANNKATWTVNVSKAPATASLCGYVFVDQDQDGMKKSGDAAVSCVNITLTGTNILGDQVSLTTRTDCQGYYSFSGLLAGTYAITETHPAGYTDGVDILGSLGGMVGSDRLSNIVLGTGQRGTGYDFTELQQSCGGYGGGRGGWSWIGGNMGIPCGGRC